MTTQSLEHAGGFAHLDLSDNEHAFHLGCKFRVTDDSVQDPTTGIKAWTLPYLVLDVSCKQAGVEMGRLHYALAASKLKDAAGPADQEVLLRETKLLLPADLRALNSGATPDAKTLRFV